MVWKAWGAVKGSLRFLFERYTRKAAAMLA